MGGQFCKQFSEYEGDNTEITLPDYLLKTPDDAIINYYSILREAAIPQKGKGAGCGTLGLAWTPYPVAYNFLSSTYREKLDYNQYLKSFENILHINLIKLKRIATVEKHPHSMIYFVEIETIEGTERLWILSPYQWPHVYGDKSNDMSFHAFNKESLSYTWIYGKTYVYPLNSNNPDFILIDSGLQDKSSKEFQKI